jgi:hypothetical protein
MQHGKIELNLSAWHVKDPTFTGWLRIKGRCRTGGVWTLHLDAGDNMGISDGEACEFKGNAHRVLEKALESIAILFRLAEENEIVLARMVAT